MFETGKAALSSLDHDALVALVAELARREPAVEDFLARRVEQAEGGMSTSQGAGARRSRALDAPEQPPPEASYMAGNSDEMQAVFRAIRRYATASDPVLVTGESGTGKELAAKAIHERSGRAKGPFIPINCAGLPPTLISSELFGHEKGAFTGAHQRKIGRIEAASGGTVFLDEIGDLPLELQAHLLRFLQTLTIERVGSTRPMKVDVRIVSATNKNLKEEVEAGRFRGDLYYRLSYLALHLPPLRNRGGDIPLLANLFLKQFAQEMGMEPAVFSARAEAAIRAHAWPGNVREMISRIRRGLVMTDDGLITPDDLQLDDVMPDLGSSPSGAEVSSVGVTPGFLETVFGDGGVPRLEEARGELERTLILRALEQSGNKIAPAAAALGISRVTFYRLLDKHELRRPPGDVHH